VSSQETFLARIRRALQRDSLQVGIRPPLVYHDRDQPAVDEVRERLRRQRPALVAQVREQLTAVGGEVCCVSSGPEAIAALRRIVEAKQARRVVRWPSELLQALEVDAALSQDGVSVQPTAIPGAGAVDPETRLALREAVSQADLGLTGVDYVIAATGTLALTALPGQMRGVSLLPPVHVAVARSDQIVATMADCLWFLQGRGDDVQRQLTSCVSFVTGPSRTGDIELTLTVGVHGPGELHLIILDTPPTT
jgi:L-lactate dehydrogenase complex protein LldG